MTNSISDTPTTKNPQSFFHKLTSRSKIIASSKLFIATTFMLIGIAGTLLACSQKDKDQKNSSLYHNDDNFFISDPFAHHHAIMSDIRRMQAHMDALFNQHHSVPNTVLNHPNVKKRALPSSTLSRKEDDKNYYYQLLFSGVDKEAVAISLKDNVLTLSANQKEEKSDKNDSQSYWRSNFYYSLSVPSRNEKIDPEINREEGKILIKIAK